MALLRLLASGNISPKNPDFPNKSSQRTKGMRALRSGYNPEHPQKNAVDALGIRVHEIDYGNNRWMHCKNNLDNLEKSISAYQKTEINFQDAVQTKHPNLRNILDTLHALENPAHVLQQTLFYFNTDALPNQQLGRDIAHNIKVAEVLLNLRMDEIKKMRDSKPTLSDIQKATLQPK